MFADTLDFDIYPEILKLCYSEYNYKGDKSLFFYEL